MKLELRHLAPYLPYNLKVMVGDGAADEIIIIYPKDLGFQTSRAFFGNINEIKPILRPIGDFQSRDARRLLELIFGTEADGLGITIENNESAVLIDVFDEDQWYYISIYNPKSNNSCISVEARYVEDNITQPIPYSVYEYLFSEHFDVFGLINKGLAIAK